MIKKTHLILFIFVLLAGTTLVKLTASEEQESSDKVHSMTINSDGTRAAVYYESKKSVTEKFGLPPKQIIQILKMIDPSLPEISEAKLEQFLKDYFGFTEIVSLRPHAVSLLKTKSSSLTKVVLSKDGKTYWIEPEATKNAIKELTKRAGINKDQSTVNFSDDLIEIIYIYKQLMEEGESLKEQT